MEFLLKEKFPKNSKNSFSSNSARKGNKKSKRKVCFNSKGNNNNKKENTYLVFLHFLKV